MTSRIFRPSAAAPLCLAAILLAAVPAMAQTSQNNGPPARVANHYDHKAFQPTETQVCGGTAADSVNCSRQGDAAAEVKKIQQDIAEINKKYPPGFLSQPGSH